MSYTKPCNKCGQRISMRQMPAGQWVAFDVLTEEAHICGIKNKPNVSIKLKNKKKSSIEDDGEDFGIKIDDLDEDIADENEDNEVEEVKTYDSSSGIHHCIDTAIKDKKRIYIEYNSEHNQEYTQREISPVKKFKEKGRTYLQAYCHKRKGERIFLTRSIASASIVDKKVTRIKLGKPKVKLIKEAIEENTYSDYDDLESNNFKQNQVNNRKNNGIETAKEIGKAAALAPIGILFNPPVLILLLILVLPILLRGCGS